MRRAFVILALVVDALTSAAVADPDCTCRSQGHDYKLGASVCLQSPKGPRIATCGMVLNNTSWQFSDQPCVISAAPAGMPQHKHAAEPAAQRGG
jgi:hypothetical protein